MESIYTMKRPDVLRALQETDKYKDKSQKQIIHSVGNDIASLRKELSNLSIQIVKSPVKSPRSSLQFELPMDVLSEIGKYNVMDVRTLNKEGKRVTQEQFVKKLQIDLYNFVILTLNRNTMIFGHRMEEFLNIQKLTIENISFEELIYYTKMMNKIKNREVRILEKGVGFKNAIGMMFNGDQFIIE